MVREENKTKKQQISISTTSDGQMTTYCECAVKENKNIKKN